MTNEEDLVACHELALELADRFKNESDPARATVEWMHVAGERPFLR